MRNFGSQKGEKRAIDVVLEAANVDFGIGEAGGKIMFAVRGC